MSLFARLVGLALLVLIAVPLQAQPTPIDLELTLTDVQGAVAFDGSVAFVEEGSLLTVVFTVGHIAGTAFANGDAFNTTANVPPVQSSILRKQSLSTDSGNVPCSLAGCTGTINTGETVTFTVTFLAESQGTATLTMNTSPNLRTDSSLGNNSKIVTVAVVAPGGGPAVDTEDIALHTYRDGELVPVTGGASTCPSNVPVGETAVAFNGDVTTTNEQGVSYEVQIGYLAGSGRLDHIGLTTNQGAWNVSLSAIETSLLLSALVTPGSPLQWGASLAALQAGTVAYTFETRLNGAVTRTETCTFNIIEPDGIILGFVAYDDPPFGSFGVNGLPVSLLDAAGNVLDTQLTHGIDVNGDGVIDPDTEHGLFLFTGLSPGMYRVRLEEHEPWEPVGGVSEQGVGVSPGGVATPGFGVTPGGPGTPGTPGGGSLPALDYGDLPTPFPDSTAVCPNAMGGKKCYQTLRTDNGPRHGIRPGLSLGAAIDLDTDGQPVPPPPGQRPGAAGDDIDGPPDDEDGVLFGFFPTLGGGASLVVSVRNETSDPAFLHTWADFNQNGQLGDTPEEYIIAGAVFPPTTGIVIQPFTFQVPQVPPDFFMRFRLTTNPDSLGPAGIAVDGEVEDYLWDATAPDISGDFGDAPDEPDPTRPNLPSGYPTRFQDDGARHAFNPLVLLGQRIDPDGDGQPTADADGDDTDLGLANDDDGIVFGQGFTVTGAVPHPRASGGVRFLYGTTPGATATLFPLASVDGMFDAWFDWNRDGDWDDAGEQVFDSVPVLGAPDTTRLTFTVPANADLGATFARFRFNLNGDLGVTGLAFDGEVEDYLLQVLPMVPVTSTANSGTGSLRQALMTANVASGPTWIILSGLNKRVAVISLESPLPPVTAPVILQGDGTILDGSAAGVDADGLVLAVAGNIVSGLTIQGFGGHGLILGAGGNLVDGSTITANGGAGILVSGSGNTLLENRIMANGGLGIDHSGDGPTPNDSGDVDGIQNAPVVLAAEATDSTRISGSLSSTPEAAFRLEFFANDACDDGGYGEGAVYLGTTTVATDGDGQATFAIALDAMLSRGQVVTATATGRDGSTSEFSQCLVATDVQEALEADIPLAFHLHANYPNPFNPETVIRFDVADHARVRLQVFDVLGRMVATLVDEVKQPGRYRTTFEADGLPSGLYFYRITAGVFSETRPMVLLK